MCAGLPIALERLADPVGGFGQRRDQRLFRFPVDGPLGSADGDGESSEHHELGRERLGRGYPDFRPGQGMQDAIHLTGDAALGLVDDPNRRRPASFGVAQGG